MKKIRIKKDAVVWGVLITLYILMGNVFAANSISASTVSGEGQLSFRVNQGENLEPAELNVATANTTVKYEIWQQLDIPLRKGADEIPASCLVMRGLRTTGALGTFYAASDAYMLLNSLTRIYTNTAGTADNLTIVYYLQDLPADLPPGSYSGQIKFTLNPTAPGETQAYKYFDVVVDVGQRGTEPSAESIQINPLSGLNRIYLNPNKEESKFFEVEVKTGGKHDSQFSIDQIAMTDFMSTTTSDKIDYNVVSCETKNVTRGRGAGLTPLTKQNQVLYTSGGNGEAGESFIVTYSVNSDLSAYKAGTYQTTLYYYVNEKGISTFKGKLDLEVEVDPVFDLVLTPEDQKGAIEFTNLEPGKEPRKSEITIEIKSNSGKQYQVNQNVLSDLTDKAGNTIAQKYFTVLTESMDSKGKVKVPAKEEVGKGDKILFVSDEAGSADKFKLIYELSTLKEMKAGDYSTRITYSLLEI